MPSISGPAADLESLSAPQDPGSGQSRPVRVGSYWVTGMVTGEKFGILTEIVVAVAGSSGYAEVLRTGSGPTWSGYCPQTQ